MTFSDFNNDYQIAIDYLDEYQAQAMNDAISAFGFNETTVSNMLYVWFGMELEAFVDSVLER